MKKYIAISSLKPLLPILKNNLLVMENDSFKVYEDKEEKVEIKVNEKIAKLAFNILKSSVKDCNLFFEIEDVKFAKTDIIDFYKWYISEEGNSVFPNDEFINDAVDYWESNVKGQTTYATILN